MENASKNKLSTLGAFKTRILSYSKDWLMYQCTISEIRLVRFDSDGYIK